MDTVDVSEIKSGNDLFHCEPYNCKLLARACVERQVKVGLSNSDSLQKCNGCSIGARVRELATDVTVDLEAIKNSARRASPNRPVKLRAPKNNPARPRVEPEVVHEVIKEEPVVAKKDDKVKPQPSTPTVAAKEPLTKEKLLRAMVAYGQYRSDAANVSEEIFEEWCDFCTDYGGELIALAIAALGRIEPARSGVVYDRTKLGSQQQAIVNALNEGKPLSVTEIAARVGRNYRNVARTLPVLQARGIVLLAENRGHLGNNIWSAAPKPASDNGPKVCVGGENEDCGKPAKFMVSFGGESSPFCAECVEEMRAVGCLEDDDAVLEELVRTN